MSWKSLASELAPDNPHSYAQAMGNWLHQYPWDWFVTLTWRDEPSSYAASSRTKSWLRWLESTVGHPVGAFIALEHFRYKGESSSCLAYHAHLLVTGVAGTSRKDVWRYTFYRHGRARIEPYDSGKGAAWYVAKYVAKECFERGEWDLWRPQVVMQAQYGFRAIS